MPNARTIRADDAPTTYAAVIDNFRRAYAQHGNGTAEELTDHEVLLCWEQGWAAPSSEEEDEWSLDAMRERLQDKADAAILRRLEEIADEPEYV